MKMNTRSQIGILVVTFVAAIALVVLWQIVQPRQVHVTFGENDVDAVGANPRTPELYFTNAGFVRDRLSGANTVNNDSSRDLISSQAFMRFAPTSPLRTDREIDLAVEYEPLGGDGDLFVSTFCPDCLGGERTIPLSIMGTHESPRDELSDRLYVYGEMPDTDTTAVVRTTPEVYGRFDLTPIASPYQATAVETMVPGVFSGDQLWAVQAEGELSLSFTKHNPNYTDEAEELLLQVFSATGEEVYVDVVSSDGAQDTTTTDVEQAVERRIPLPVAGLYFIELTAAADTVEVRDLTVSTDKVVLLRAENVFSDTLYTEVRTERTVAIAHGAVEQAVRFEGEDTSVVGELHPSYWGVTQPLSLPVGSYSVQGMQRVGIVDGVFSSSVESFFHPFVWEMSTEMVDVPVVTSTRMTALEDGRYRAEATIPRADARHFATIPADSDRHGFRYDVRLTHLTDRRADTLFGEEYVVGEVCGLALWASYDAVAAAPPTGDCSDVAGAVQGRIPVSEAVVNGSSTELQVLHPEFAQGESSDPVRYRLNTRGESHLFIESGGTVDVSITKTDLNGTIGADPAVVYLIDPRGVVVDTAPLPDDGNNSNNRSEAEVTASFQYSGAAGVYELLVSPLSGENTFDFFVRDVVVNSPRLSIGGKTLFVEATPITVSVSGTRMVDVDVPTSKKNELVLSGPTQKTLSFSAENQSRKVRLDAGVYTTTTLEPNTTITGAVLSTDPERLLPLPHYPNRSWTVTDGVSFPRYRLYNLRLNY